MNGDGSIRVFIVAHKAFHCPTGDAYRTIAVGDKKDSVAYDVRDDVGDHIADRNALYGELTGLYWIWKNDDSDIVGLTHYRRYFTKSLWSDAEEHFLKAEEIPEILDRYEMILPCRSYYLRSNDRVYHGATKYPPDAEDLEGIRKAIQELYPDYLGDYEAFLGKNYFFPYNMFVMRREILEKYCQWMFDVLFYAEKIHRKDDDRQRVLGCVGERMMDIWLSHNLGISGVKELPVVNTERNVNLAWQGMKNGMKRVCYRGAGRRHAR